MTTCATSETRLSIKTERGMGLAEGLQGHCKGVTGGGTGACSRGGVGAGGRPGVWGVEGGEGGQGRLTEVMAKVTRV